MNCKISDYNYPLPDERIAKFPLQERDKSKLLLYRHGEVGEDVFSNLPSYLPQGALMVFNNTKVIQARLHFRKPTGALIEIFLLEPVAPRDYEQMFQSRGECSWICLIGNQKKWKEGALCSTLSSLNTQLTAQRGAPCGTGIRIDFLWDNPDVSFSEILEAAGELPIPPYLNRETQESDKTTYQTVYSKIKGSVAAPTAGLHFTDRVLQALDQHGIERDEVTLHVGAGTFKPVKSEEISGHEMHTEYICVQRRTIEKLLAHDCQAIAVGTTSVRTLESLYYMGLKVLRNPDVSEEELHVSQWEPYTLAQPSFAKDSRSSSARLQSEAAQVTAKRFASEELSNREALLPSEATKRTLNSPLSTLNSPLPTKASTSLRALLDWLDRHHLSSLHSSTQIIIVPGYEYKIVKMLVTNFHQPKSTLLLLVSAFVGGNWRTIYDYALAHDFRFLSYGDSSLLIP